jgi:hypothetical protein
MSDTRDAIPELKRPLPNFQQWLDDHGHTDRGDGFAEMAKLAEAAQQMNGAILNEDAKAFLRFWQGFSVAIVELCNIEHQHGRSAEQTTRTMARAQGCAALYTVASVLREGSPWRSIAKILVEEFKFGAKVAADKMTDSEMRAESAP